MRTPKKTWKNKSQYRLSLEEREYVVSLRRTDFPLYYTPLNLSELVVTNWLDLRRRCSHTFQRVLFVWPSDNESKSYRIPLDLIYRLTLRKTLHIAVFKPLRWYVNRLFGVRVLPTILWLGWDTRWIELGRFEGGNFTVQELLAIERSISWNGVRVSSFELGRFKEEVELDRWEKRIQWLSEKQLLTRGSYVARGNKQSR